MDIETIKSALANVTDYPWKQVVDTTRPRITLFGRSHGKFSVTRVARITGGNIQNNADFIVKAPEYIEYLLKEIERLNK